MRRAEAAVLSEREQWPLWAPVALGSGIAMWFALPAAQFWGAALAVALGSALLCWRLGALGRLIGWGGLLVALGVALAWARAEAVRAPVFPLDGAARVVTGIVDSHETLGDGRERVILRIEDIERLTPGETPERVRLTSRGALEVPLKRGAKVRVKAWLQPPPGPSVPGGYDFARRAWFEGIGAVGVPLGDVTVVMPPPPARGIMERLETARETLSARLRERIGGEAGGMAAALVTGDRSGISDEVTEAMRNSGLAHLVSISGLHIGMVTGLVFLLTRRVLALSPWLALRLPLKTYAALAAAIAAVAYTLIAGSSLPTVRSCIATLIVLAGLLLGREAISLRLVAAGAGLILLFRPEAVLSPSFQLSFAAVTGLVALYQSRFAERWLRRRETDGRGRSALRWAAGLIVSSLVAEAMLSPIAIAHFNQTGVYGVIANFVAIPLTSILIMPGLMLAVAAESIGGVPWVTEVLRWALDLLIGIARSVAAWDGAVMRWRALGGGPFSLMMLGLIWLCLWRTRLRLLGLGLTAAGLVLAAMTPTPDLYVSADGGLMAVRLEDGRMAFSSLRRGSFTRAMWLEDSGLDARAVARLDEAAGPALVQECDEGLCRVSLNRHGDWRRIVWLKDWLDNPVLARVCVESDVIIAPRGLPRWCQPKLLKLDEAGRKRLGAVTVRFGPSGTPDVQAAQTQRGRHPWVTAAR
ncbi:MAG TPA: ComEC/Rec2 family competence protein [Pedomonas sp.]|uniref:ComEC/Rec2 family competence protein n=1 Tax=Pedomonas sp. TaxID=2976421 RepID=UPI002F428795